MKNFISRFKHIPIGCTGLGLGIGGLGALYTAVIQNYYPNLSPAIASIVQYVCIFFTILFVLLILLRNTTHKKIFSNEIKHSLLSSFVPTICMSTMVIAGFIGSLADITGVYEFKYVGAVLWYLAVAAHLLIFVFFLVIIVRKHKIRSDSLFASWFVPPVGIIVSCTVAPSFSNMTTEWIPPQLFQAIFFFGFALYIITLPIVAYKLIFHRTEDKNTFPSIAIFGAPANLSLAGFLSVFTKANKPVSPYPVDFINGMLIVMLFFAVATTLVVYLLLPRIFSINFNPTYASLTFPLAIGSTAVFKSYLYIKANFPNLNILISIIRYVGYIELAIATLVILYVLIRYLILIGQKLFKSNSIVWKLN